MKRLIGKKTIKRIRLNKRERRTKARTNTPQDHAPPSSSTSPAGGTCLRSITSAQASKIRPSREALAGGGGLLRCPDARMPGYASPVEVRRGIQVRGSCLDACGMMPRSGGYAFRLVCRCAFFIVWNWYVMRVMFYGGCLL